MLSKKRDDAAMRKHVKQWQNSSLTQIAYCNKHNIKPHVFSYYKKKFCLPATPVDSLEAPGRFLPVHLLAAHGLEALPQCAVTHPFRHSNSFSLEFNSGTELGYVNKPPAKAGGFKLRLKAGFYRPIGSITGPGNHHLVHRAFVLQYIFSIRHPLHSRLTQPNNLAPIDATPNIAFSTLETLITIYASFYPSEIAQPLIPISAAVSQLADGRDPG